MVDRLAHKPKQSHKEKWFRGEIVPERETIRRYLAEDRGYKCEICGISDWQGKRLVLHVDHTDGNPADSRPENVRLLCPNCHSQTPYLGNGNRGRGRKAQGLNPK
jgi:5-methylcytosine-specific restriction endonuclease McrA